jgi:hypothetical protein
MNYTGSLAMSHWFFSTAMGVVGGCRQLAQITMGKRRQPTKEIAPRNNTDRQAQEFFPPQITVSGGKFFFGPTGFFPF